MSHHPARTSQKPTRPLLDEADIGSGEKTPGQQETEEIIRQIPPLPASEHRGRRRPRQTAAPPRQPAAPARSAGLAAP